MPAEMREEIADHTSADAAITACRLLNDEALAAAARSDYAVLALCRADPELRKRAHRHARAAAAATAEGVAARARSNARTRDGSTTERSYATGGAFISRETSRHAPTKYQRKSQNSGIAVKRRKVRRLHYS